MKPKRANAGGASDPSRRPPPRMSLRPAPPGSPTSRGPPTVAPRDALEKRPSMWGHLEAAPSLHGFLSRMASSDGEQRVERAALRREIERAARRDGDASGEQICERL